MTTVRISLVIVNGITRSSLIESGGIHSQGHSWGIFVRRIDVRLAPSPTRCCRLNQRITVPVIVLLRLTKGSIVSKNEGSADKDQTDLLCSITNFIGIVNKHRKEGRACKITLFTSSFIRTALYFELIHRAIYIQYVTAKKAIKNTSRTHTGGASCSIHPIPD